MKEEIWNELYLYYLIRIEIGVLKNFKECARSPCNGNHFSSYVGMYVEMRNLKQTELHRLKNRGKKG